MQDSRFSVLIIPPLSPLGKGGRKGCNPATAQNARWPLQSPLSKGGRGDSCNRNPVGALPLWNVAFLSEHFTGACAETPVGRVGDLI